MERSSVVLITGANTGLGFQMVRVLCSSDRRYDILLGGRSLDKAEQAADAAKREHPSSSSKVHAIQIDITDDESVHSALEEVATKFGKIDALVNNAGT